MCLALAHLYISTCVLWCHRLYKHISISGKGWSFQNCLCNLRAQVRFCRLKSLRLHKVPYYSAFLSKDLLVWNVGKVSTTAGVGRGLCNNENQKSDSCSVYFTCASRVYCRRGTVLVCVHARAFKELPKRGSENGVVRVREGGWAVDTGGPVEWSKVTWCRRTAASW